MFDQNLAATLPADTTALEYVMYQAPRAGETRARGILGALGLPGDAAMRDIGPLSGGEKARVALSALGAAEHNVLLLDEPTNHLDAVTVEVLVRALRAFDGALVLVSHDRFLVEQVATHVAVVHEGKLELHEGIKPSDLEPKAAAKQGERNESSADVAETYEARKRASRAIDKAKRELQRLEKRLDALDTNISEVDAQLFDPALDYEQARVLGEKRDALEAEQLQTMQLWEAASTIVDGS